MLKLLTVGLSLVFLEDRPVFAADEKNQSNVLRMICEKARGSFDSSQEKEGNKNLTCQTQFDQLFAIKHWKKACKALKRKAKISIKDVEESGTDTLLKASCR